MFIAFEGLDGSGSSTQARLLAEKLTAAGHPALVTKEPTSTNPIGRLIREVLQHKWQASPEGLQLLFSADRAEHLKDEIRPALEKGQVVITDRYFFSTIAFGSLEVKDVEWLRQLNRLFPLPDLTFLFKLDPAECIKRIQSRGTQMELFEKEEKLKTIWKHYESAVRNTPGLTFIEESERSPELAGQIQRQYETEAQKTSNFFLIDASKSIDAIANEIWEIVQNRVI